MADEPPLSMPCRSLRDFVSKKFYGPKKRYVVNSQNNDGAVSEENCNNNLENGYRKDASNDCRKDEINRYQCKTFINDPVGNGIQGEKSSSYSTASPSTADNSVVVDNVQLNANSSQMVHSPGRNANENGHVFQGVHVSSHYENTSTSDNCSQPSLSSPLLPDMESESINSSEAATVPSPDAATVPSSQAATVPSPDAATVSSPKAATLPKLGVAIVPPPGATTGSKPGAATIPPLKEATVPSSEAATVSSSEAAAVPSPEAATVPSSPEAATVPATVPSSPEAATVPATVPSSPEAAMIPPLKEASAEAAAVLSPEAAAVPSPRAATVPKPGAAKAPPPGTATCPKPRAANVQSPGAATGPPSGPATISKPGATIVLSPGAATVPPSGPATISKPGATIVLSSGAATVLKPRALNIPSPGAANVQSPGAATGPPSGPATISKPGATIVLSPGAATVPPSGPATISKPVATIIQSPGAANCPPPGAATVPKPRALNIPSPGAATCPKPRAANVQSPEAATVPPSGPTTISKPGATTVPNLGATSVSSVSPVHKERLGTTVEAELESEPRSTSHDQLSFSSTNGAVTHPVPKRSKSKTTAGYYEREAPLKEDSKHEKLFHNAQKFAEGCNQLGLSDSLVKPCSEFVAYENVEETGSVFPVTTTTTPGATYQNNSNTPQASTVNNHVEESSWTDPDAVYIDGSAIDNIVDLQDGGGEVHNSDSVPIVSQSSEYQSYLSAMAGLHSLPVITSPSLVDQDIAPPNAAADVQNVAGAVCCNNITIQSQGNLGACVAIVEQEPEMAPIILADPMDTYVPLLVPGDSVEVPGDEALMPCMTGAFLRPFTCELGQGMDFDSFEGSIEVDED